MNNLLFAIFALASAILLTEARTGWNDLKTTFSINPLDSNGFKSHPRTIVEAVKQGWKPEKDCSTPGVIGNRYIYKDDPALLLVFDSTGYIAGVASSIPQGLPLGFPSAQQAEYMRKEGNRYTYNFFFMDPKQVCNGVNPGKALSETGDRIVIVGDKKNLTMPLTEAEVQRDSFWTKGKCFFGMGQHYWANLKGIPLTKSAKSEEVFPFFMMYNDGKLNVVALFSSVPITSPTGRFESPPNTEAFWTTQFVETPTFLTAQGVPPNSLHVFLDSNPRITNNCFNSPFGK